MTKDLERRLARMAGESPSVEERLDAMLRSGAETDAPSSPKYLPGKKSKSGGSVVSKLPIEKQTDRVKNLPKANTGKIRLTMAKTPTETEYGALSLDELREEQKRLKQRISALRSANQGGLMTFTRANDQNAARLRTATEQLDEVNKQIRTVQENQKNNAAALASLAEEQKYAGMSSTDMLAQLEELKELRDAAQERANQTSRGITALPSTTAKSTRESLADARERAETDYNKYAKAYNDLLNRYYKTENEEKKAAIQQDRDMSSSYQSAQDIQADMDKVAVLMGWVGQKTGDPQEAEAAKIYLMDKYGIDQQAIDQYAISGAGGAYTPRTDGGYNNLYELYQELEAKKEQAVSDLSEGGYDYERMAGYAQMQEDAERSKKNMAQWQETANKYPVLSSIDTLLFAPVQGIDFLKAMGSNIGHSDTDDPESYVPMNSYNMDAVNYVNTVRQTVASDIEENTDWDLFGQNVASFLYQTGMSIGDSSLNLLAFGPTGALVVGGSNAAANQAKDIIDRGGTKEQAFLGGMAAGTFEAIFEKVSIDHLLATKSVTGWKSWLKETAQQAGVEASEETFTEIANILADASIMGDNSNFNRSVDAYIAQGMSQKDAQSQAFMDLIGQVVQAGVGGAVSGGAMGGTVNARNWMSHINTITRTNQDIVNRVNQRLSQPGQVMADFMDAGLPLPTAISEKARNRQAEQNNRLVLPGNEQNNTASTGETVNENGLIPLTKQAADRLSTGKNNIIAKKTSDIISFVRNALRKKGGPERLYLGTIPDAAAKFIQDETGVNVAGYTAILPGDSVQHIFKNHGTDATEAPRGQRAVTEDDIALIPQVLSNPDRVSLSPDTDVLGRNVLILEKRIGDTYITAQAVTDGRHALTTNSLWIQKEKDRPTTPDAGHKTGPEGNAQSALPQDPSIDSILPDGENVNIQEAMDDPVNRLYELLGENGRRAITHMYDGMGDMDLYVQDFVDAYLAGLAGRERPVSPNLTQAQVQAAYYAGQNDAGASLISERAEAGSATIHSDARFVPNEYSAEMDTDTVNYLDALAKATGTKIQMAAATGEGGANGWYRDGTIYIATDADKPAIEVAKHEITHRLQEIAPEEYRQYRNYAVKALAEKSSTADLVELYKARYAEAGVELNTEQAMDEIAADFTEALIVDPARFARLSQDNRSVARKLLDAIKHFVSKVKSAFSDSARRNAAARDTFGVDLGTLEEAARLWEQALAAGAERVRNTQASSLQTQRADATMGNTRYSMKKGDENRDRYGNERTGSTSEQEGFFEQRGDVEIQGTADGENEGRSVSGRPELLAASFGEVPAVDWTKDNVIEPEVGSVAYSEQQDVMEYHIPSFVISDRAWAEIGKKAPAFSANGQIFLKETLAQKNKGMCGIHEITHVMKQLGYRPYMDFIQAVQNMLNFDAVEARILLEHVAHHRSIDVFGADGYLDIGKLNALSPKNRITLYDELNATLYGHIGSGKYGDNLQYLQKAFYDFDSYSDQLTSIHEKFKQERGGQPRFSLKGTGQLQHQVQNLEERNRYLQEQLKRTKGIKTDRKKTASFARNLLTAYESQYDRDTLTGELLDIYDEIANSRDGVDMDGLRSKAREVAERVLEQSVRVDAEAYNEYSSLRNYLRTTRIKVPKSIHAGLEPVGGYNGFRRGNSSRMKLSVSEGMDIDTLYRELSQQYPGLFDEQAYTNPADQLINISDVLDSIQPVVSNPYSSDMEMAARFVANEILEGYFDVPQQRPTFADRQEARVEAARAAGNRRLTEQRERGRQQAEELRQRNRDTVLAERMAAGRENAAMRRRYDQRIAQLRQQGREQVQSAISRERKRRADQVQAIKEKYTSRDIAARERRNARELRNRIQRHVQALSTRLLNPTDSRNVPETLRRPVAALLEAVNLESNYSLDPDTIRPIARKDGKYGGVTGKRLSADDERGVATKRTQAFIELRNAYQQIMNEGDGEMVIDPALLGDQASGFQGSFDKVISMHDKRLADMSVQELETVLQTVRAVEFSISTAGKNLTQSKFAGTLDWAMAMREENRGKRPRNTTERHYTIDLLTPLTYFSRFGDSGMAVYRMLRNAQDAQQQMITDLSEETAGIVTPAEAREMRYKTHQFTTQSNQELTLTTAQIMSLYELSKRKQAQEHIYTGGIYQPAVPGTNIKRGTEAIHLTPYDVGKILDTLTPDQIMVADRLQQIMATTLADLGNEASMKAYGYKKFTGADYWPITSAREGIRSTVENGGMNTRAVANIGLAKSTVPNANNPLDIKDAFTTFTEHAADMTDYAAYLLPMEDANRLYNFRFKDSGQAIKGLLDRTGGPRSTNYWERLMEDIQNGTSARSDSELSGLAGRIISRTKGASVGANLRVIAQQPTAYLRALAVLSPTNLSKGLAGGATGGSGWVKALKWAPIAQKKQVGGFEIGSGVGLEQELFGDLTKGAKLAVNRISNAAMWGAGKMDEITWGKIWNACEWEVTSRNKELVKGSDAFYKAVAELFTRVIDESQVVDGVMQRSQVMRSNSDLNKMATAFMGEPTMSLNLMMRSYDNAVRATSPAARSAARKKFARAGMALVLSGVVNAAVQSLVDAGRDDDKDKKYWERFISAFTGLTGEEESLADKVSAAALRSNISGNLNPVGQIPYANDVLSMLQGYDVYRMDAEAIGDFITAGQNVANNIGGTGTRTPAYALKELANAAAKVFGISVGNVLRDAAGILNSYAVETDDAGLMYEIDKIGYNISNSSNKSRFLDIAFKARETGDTETYNRIAKDLIAAGVLEDMDDFEDQMARRLKATGTFTSEQDKVETEISTKVQSSSLYKGIDQEYKEKLMDKVEAYSYAVTMHQQYPDYELGKSYDWVEKVQSGSSVGLTPDEYILFDFAYNNVITSDKDEDGKSIPGSKQEKVIDFMEGMDLTDEEWNYLWNSVGYSSKNNPRK